MLKVKIKMAIFEIWGRIYDIPGYLKYYEIKNGDIIVDAGAYSGLFSKFASNKVGATGKVIAFEPDPENFKILEKKFKNIKNVLLINKGLFDYQGELVLRRDPVHGSLGSSFTTNDNSSVTFNVPITTLDYELKRLGIPSVDFIKMDIEGAEIEAIKGMREILSSSYPNLAIACYHKRNNEETSVSLKKTLSKYYSNIKIGNLLHKTLFAQRNFKKVASH